MKTFGPIYIGSLCVLFKECGVLFFQPFRNNIYHNSSLSNAFLFLCRKKGRRKKPHLKYTTLLIIHDHYSLINFPQPLSPKPACLCSYEQTWLLGYYVALRQRWDEFIWIMHGVQTVFKRKQSAVRVTQSFDQCLKSF